MTTTTTTSLPSSFSWLTWLQNALLALQQEKLIPQIVQHFFLSFSNLVSAFTTCDETKHSGANLNQMQCDCKQIKASYERIQTDRWLVLEITALADCAMSFHTNWECTLMFHCFLKGPKPASFCPLSSISQHNDKFSTNFDYKSVKVCLGMEPRTVGW